MRDSLAVRRSGGFGLVLDEDFATGRSERCGTYGNPPLARTTRFTCANVELWAFEN